MASIGDGSNSLAIEQDPSIAQIQAAQIIAQQAVAALPESGFVASINALVGILTIAAGTSSAGFNISIGSDAVSTITIAVTTTLTFGTIVSHNQAAAVTDLHQTISNPPTQAEVQALSNKVDELLDSLRTAGIIAP